MNDCLEKEAAFAWVLSYDSGPGSQQMTDFAQLHSDMCKLVKGLYVLGHLLLNQNGKRLEYSQV